MRNAQEFPAFWQHFLETHARLDAEGKGNKGHGLDHDLMVAGYTQLVAQDRLVTGERAFGWFASDGVERRARAEHVRKMVWAAALVHSYDRFFGDETNQMLGRALAHLPWSVFRSKDILEILAAVSRHDHFNAPEDGIVQIILQDADRLANIGSIVIARSGQFNPGIPTVLLGNTTGMERAEGSTYKKPRSVRCDLVGCLEWENDPRVCIRLDTAKRLAKPHFDILKVWFRQTELKFNEAGIGDWPWQ